MSLTVWAILSVPAMNSPTSFTRNAAEGLRPSSICAVRRLAIAPASQRSTHMAGPLEYTSSSGVKAPQDSSLFASAHRSKPATILSSV